ncbi:hypothetical protein ACFX13_006251 [Malus domestica]
MNDIAISFLSNNNWSSYSLLLYTFKVDLSNLYFARTFTQTSCLHPSYLLYIVLNFMKSVDLLSTARDSERRGGDSCAETRKEREVIVAQPLVDFKGQKQGESVKEKLGVRKSLPGKKP